MATIYDIAAQCGLSPATVSRVLSGKSTSAINREKVMQAAQALNYHNMAYLDQSVGYTRRQNPLVEKKTILLVPGRNGIEGAYTAARELGYAVELTSTSPEGELYIRNQLNSGAAAGLLINTAGRPEFIQACARSHPTVLIADDKDGLGTHTVWIDDTAAYQQLLSHLEQQNRRRIWCFASKTQRDRLYHAENSLIQQQSNRYLFFDVSNIYSNQSFAQHLPLVNQILSMPAKERPDALVLPNSVVASCIVCLLRIRGIRIPEDIAIVSLLGGDHDRNCEPYLTSVLPPFNELNYEGMRILDNLIHGKIVPNKVHYPHRMHYGGSTRPELAPFREELV